MEPQEIEQAFVRLGEELGLDARCIVRPKETSVIFEDVQTGSQHVFTFATDPGVEL